MVQLTVSIMLHTLQTTMKFAEITTELRDAQNCHANLLVFVTEMLIPKPVNNPPRSHSPMTSGVSLLLITEHLLWCKELEYDPDKDFILDSIFTGSKLLPDS